MTKLDINLCCILFASGLYPIIVFGYHRQQHQFLIRWAFQGASSDLHHHNVNNIISAFINPFGIAHLLHIAVIFAVHFIGNDKRGAKTVFAKGIVLLLLCVGGWLERVIIATIGNYVLCDSQFCFISK